jgi:DNA-binding LacI/PurR family transcriptional regulator
VLSGLHRHGLAAPSDMAVIGVDNIPAAELATPALTTVDFHPASIGRYLASIVLGELEEVPTPQAFLRDTLTLMIRESA